MPEFELTQPARTIFGTGTLRRLGGEAKALGAQALLVCGANPMRVHKARESLAAAGVSCTAYNVSREPTLDCVEEGVKTAKETGCTLVVGVGGGSVLDAGKAIAAMAANPGSLTDHLEVVGKGNPLSRPPLPYIAVPTTAGTGTEATRNAVLTSPSHRVKVSLRHPLMVPRIALLDPELTLTMPPDITAATGMDALCQLIEPFTCRTPNPFVDALCREGMGLAARALPRVFANGEDVEARSDMMLAAHFSGLALANAKLGAVHGFAAPLGGMTGAAHGALCAALLPAVVTVNIEAIRRREPAHPALKRFQEAARILTGDASAAAEEVATFTDRLRREMGIPRLRDLGVQSGEFGVVCEAAAKASSMKGNPVELTTEELKRILEMAF